MSALKKLAAFRHAFILLRRNDPLILASATAFFTTFSLPPIIIILVSVLGLYFKSEHIRQQLFDKLTSMLGGAATGEIEKIVHNFMKLEGNAWVTAGGFLFLLFVATTLLSIIRKAIHQLWHIRRKSSMKLYYGVKERMLGLGMLLFIGLLFLASILMDASVSLFRRQLHDIFPDVDAMVIRILNIVFSILVVTIWFTVLFKVLPEARVKWRVAFAGGFLTGLLFSIGKLDSAVDAGGKQPGNDLRSFGVNCAVAVVYILFIHDRVLRSRLYAFVWQGDREPDSRRTIWRRIRGARS